MCLAALPLVTIKLVACPLSGHSAAAAGPSDAAVQLRIKQITGSVATRSQCRNCSNV